MSANGMVASSAPQSAIEVVGMEAGKAKEEGKEELAPEGTESEAKGDGTDAEEVQGGGKTDVGTVEGSNVAEGEEAEEDVQEDRKVQGGEGIELEDKDGKGTEGQEGEGPERSVPDPKAVGGMDGQDQTKPPEEKKKCEGDATPGIQENVADQGVEAPLGQAQGNEVVAEMEEPKHAEAGTQSVPQHEVSNALENQASVQSNAGEPKLFVGCIGKQTTLGQLVMLFEPYGKIVESSILKNLNGMSKGCGFITYSTFEECQEAIKHLHQQHTFPGSTSPIQVSLANPKRDRKTKRQEQFVPRESKRIARPSVPQVEPYSSGTKPGYGNYGRIPFQGNPQQGYGVYAQQQPMQYGGMYEPPMLDVPVTSNMGGFQGGYGMYGGVGNVNMGAAYSDLLGAGMSQVSNMGMNAGTGMSMNQPAGSLYIQTAGYEPSSAGFQRQDKSLAGPPGANLFVLGLPDAFTNEDLMQLFSQCGQLAEVRVSFDHQTHKSKGYGFVSYYNTQAADLAMQMFNGYAVGNKTLKIERRRKQS